MSAPRLFVVTQAIDTDDPVLGFFHGWLRAFASHFPHIHAVGLRTGEHDLPHNVVVHSLGKERGVGRLAYIVNFYRLIWRLRHEYDAVFVHMNPEYVVLGGIVWRLLGKRVYLWRNHWARGLVTDIAVLLSHKTFCTSRASYIAKYTKNVLMPVGVDTDVFKPVPGVERRPGSILSLGRISPSKNIDVILEALKLLKDGGVEFTASIYGDALPKDAEYLEQQKKYVEANGLSRAVTFYPGVTNAATPAIYSAHAVFVNASGSGMLDKTIFEAAACESLAVASSADYAADIGEKLSFAPGDARALFEKLRSLLLLSEDEASSLQRAGKIMVLDKHSLAALCHQLAATMAI